MVRIWGVVWGLGSRVIVFVGGVRVAFLLYAVLGL